MPASTQSKTSKLRRKTIPPAIQRAIIGQEQTPKRADFWGAYLDRFVLAPSDPILRDKGNGNLDFYEPVRQDDQVKACFSQLVAAIISRETIVLPGGDKPIDIEAAEDLKRQLAEICWDDICSKMAWGQFWGFSIAEAMWEQGENGRVKLANLLPRHRKRFLWTYENEIRWRNNRDYNGAELLPNKYWHFSLGDDSIDDPNGRGLAYWLYWPTFFKRQGMRWWILFLEKYAKPHRHGTYQPGATDEDIASLEDALQAFGEDDWTTSPEGTTISLIEASRAGGSDYQAMIDICNAAIAKVVVGQTMTTDNGSSRSQAEVHQDVGTSIAKQLSDVICQSFSDSIGRWLTQWNFPGAAIPKVWRQFDVKDIKAEADTDTVLSALGIKLKAEAIAEKYGDNYEIPEADDALTQLSSEQVNALVLIVSNAQQGGWKPELVAGLIKGAFPSWPDKAIAAITKNLGGDSQNGGGQTPPPIDPAKAGELLDNAKFEAEPDPLLPIAEALLAKLESAEFQSAEFRNVPGKQSGAIKKKPNCKPTSHSCGGSCISGKYTCRIKATQEAQSAIADLKAKLAEAESKAAKEPEVKAGFVGEINAKDIKADPKRFQYKLIGEHTKTGEVGSLSGVSTYDPNLAGVVQVWRDPKDQNLYVINGHNRLALANRAGAEKVTARVIDAPDAAHARAIGALTNIAEGRGTGLDAAKFFKDTGLTIEDLKKKGIPMREQIAQKGLAIAQLEPGLFAKVVNGDLPEARAAIIGDAGLKPEQQKDLYELSERKGKKLTDAALNELVAGVKASSSVGTVEQFDLFGGTLETKTNAIERANLAAGIRSQLGKDKRIFGLVARSQAAKELARGNNIIDQAASKDIAQQSAQTMAVFDELKHSSGPIAKALNAAAVRVAGGEKQGAVQKELYSQIAEIIKGGKF
jgi:phage gp29-like protein